MNEHQDLPDDDVAADTQGNTAASGPDHDPTVPGADGGSADGAGATSTPDAPDTPLGGSTVPHPVPDPAAPTVSDPVPADAPHLTAMLRALVEDAPASSVGPLSVLAEVRGRRQRRVKVGRGILVAAAVVGVFAVVVPRISSGAGGSNSAADVAAGVATSAAAGDTGGQAESGAQTGVLDGAQGSSAGLSSAATGSVHPPARDDSGTASGSGSGGGVGSPSDGGGAVPQSGEPGAETGGAIPSASAVGTSAAPTSAASTAGVASSSGAGVTLAPLPTPLLTAAVQALPRDTVTGVGDVTLPSAGDARSGSLLHTTWGGSITVVLAAGTDHSTGSTGSTALVASDTANGLTAVVSADAASAGHLTESQLHAVATAVLAATR